MGKLTICAIFPLAKKRLAGVFDPARAGTLSFRAVEVVQLWSAHKKQQGASPKEPNKKPARSQVRIGGLTQLLGNNRSLLQRLNSTGCWPRFA